MSDETTFLGYCFDKEGKYYPATPLKDLESVIGYVNLHKAFYPEIRITDTADDLVMHVINGVVVWPKIQSEGN